MDGFEKTSITDIDFSELENVKRMPMVALRGKVVLPNVFTSFDVGRIKSLNAVNSAIDSKESLIFVAAQKDARIENPSASDVCHIGVVCRIKHISRMPGDNLRVNVDALYTAEIVIEANDSDKFFSVGIREIYPDYGDETETEAYYRFVKNELRAYVSHDGVKINKDVFNNILAVEKAHEFVNSATYNMHFKESEKQIILELASVKDKLYKFYQLLVKELEIAKAQHDISERVKASVEKNQREFYLREQLKAIHAELGDNENEKEELENRIKEKKMPKEIEEKALKELFRMGKMNPSSPDYMVLNTYLDWLLDLPFSEISEDRADLNEAIRILDEDHYGLEKVKQRIVEYLAVLKLTGKVGGSILCLYGPPGVGKTSIAKSVARSLGRKFVRMSLGGVKDEAEIRGHRKTYVGAIPGRIIYAMKEAGTVNPVILLDEIDKLSSDLRGDPASALLEVLDPEQNVTFRDRYLEIPYDLSKVLFITTANSLSTIPAPLLDRMEIIELNGYTRNEKYEIAKRYLINKSAEKNGLNSGKIEIKDNAIYRLIDGYTREAGVRTLEREIGSLCRKVATSFAGGKRKRKYVVGEKEVEELLGGEKYSYTDELREDEVGACTGLAWTAVGGTTLTIEVALLKGKGEIFLTGKLGDVMKESAKIAHSFVKINAEKLGVNLEKFTNYDVHIHIPEGATPKDGPSAGITMVTAITSAFTDIKVRGDVAMTGEVTLRGKVLPIGGLKEKSLAAYRLGIRTVIIPKKNTKDLEDIPENIRKEMKFIPVDTVNEVLKNALVNR
ncbi:MAG: endopeptidase La [Clostridia bacterium]|nr:endopeptidase La [Clostridia bacterium]